VKPHVRVPRLHVTTSGAPLGKWLDNQKSALRAQRLTPRRQRALAAVDPDWFSPPVGPRLKGAPTDPTHICWQPREFHV